MKSKALNYILLVAAIMLLANSFGMAQKPAKTEEIKIQTDLDCASCKKKIEDYMAFERGVTAVSADVPTKIVTIEYRPNRTDEEKLIAAIKKLGYKAEIIDEKEKTE